MTDNKNIPTAKKKRLSFQAIVSIIIICLLIVVYIWNRAETCKLQKQHETELNDIQAKANQTIADINKKNIETLTRVFAWAVRSEMLRNNLDQVNTYMTYLVKAADLSDISVIKTDGIVLLSTNKKYENNSYPGPVSTELSNINEVTSRTGSKGNLMCICPVMGLDSRLGTVVINYTPKTSLLNKGE